jgi:hypothetical protein
MSPHRFGFHSWLLAAPLCLAPNMITGLTCRHPSFTWATNNISDAPIG